MVPLLFVTLGSGAIEMSFFIQFKSVREISIISVVLRIKHGASLFSNVDLEKVHVVQKVFMTSGSEVRINILPPVEDVCSFSPAQATPHICVGFSPCTVCLMMSLLRVLGLNCEFSQFF